MQANIFINPELCAFLADFGFSRIIDETSSAEVVGKYKAGDAVRWMAPELLDPKRYGYIKGAQRKLPSKSTDIYAFGMTILEARMGSPLLPLSCDLILPL